MNEFLKRLKSVAGLMSSLSVLLPAYSFFSENAPPLFSEIGIITAAISLAFLYLGFRSAVTDETKIRNMAKWYLIVSLVLVIGYLIMLQLTSVKISNSKQSHRYQIGFQMQPWSLTDSGVVYLRVCNPSTPKQFLICLQATEESVYFLWDGTYVLLFGLVNIVLFCMASFCWAYGWGAFLKLVPGDG